MDKQQGPTELHSISCDKPICKRIWKRMYICVYVCVYIYIYIYESLFCTAENNTTLKINYTSMEKKSNIAKSEQLFTL